MKEIFENLSNLTLSHSLIVKRHLFKSLQNRCRDVTSSSRQANRIYFEGADDFTVNLLRRRKKHIAPVFMLFFSKFRKHEFHQLSILITILSVYVIQSAYNTSLCKN